MSEEGSNIYSGMALLSRWVMKRYQRLRILLENVARYGMLGDEPVCDPKSKRYQKLEQRVPAFTLPDPLVALDGTRVEDARTWYEKRRPEILELFRTNVYGHDLCQRGKIVISSLTVDEFALNGHATREELLIGIAEKPEFPALRLLIYLPNIFKKQKKKVPLFVGLNFLGNQTIHKDACISINSRWISDNPITKGKPPGMLRGIDSSSWPVEFILERGYGLATAYYGDIVPDCAVEIGHKIQKWFGESEAAGYAAGSWGAIGGWAWSLSRVMDYIEQDVHLDAEKVIVMGHSRLGKAALWAGAQDERFAAVISNESGCGGAALARRNIGETVAEINCSFPHWFCDNFKHFNELEDTLPVDQHELIALIAPRPVYIACARHDLHADPMGEFLAVKFANPVYRLLGTSGLPATELPAVNLPVMGTMGYHIRKGRHGITLFDWTQFIDFADMHFINRHYL